MDGLKKFLGWFLLGVAVLTLALLPFSYTAWPWNALGVLALGTGVLLVVAGSRLGQDTDSAASAAPVRGTPWWQQGLAFVAGLTVVSLPNFATVSGALLLSTNGAGSHQDQQLLTAPEALRAGVTAIRLAAGGAEISSLQVDHSGAVAVLPDGHGAARKFDYRRPGTLAAAGSGSCRPPTTGPPTSGRPSPRPIGTGSPSSLSGPSTTLAPSGVSALRPPSASP